MSVVPSSTSPCTMLRQVLVIWKPSERNLLLPSSHDPSHSCTVDEEENNDQATSLTPTPLAFHGRRISNTMKDFRSLTVDKERPGNDYLSDGNDKLVRRPSLRISIPVAPITSTINATVNERPTPRDVTTTSKCPVAHGPLSDIYMGEWYDVQKQEVSTVAIKLLRVLVAKDEDGVRARKKLNREVYVWQRLQHPNVVKVFGTSYHMSGYPAIIMQWYGNGSAVEYLANKNPGADRLQLILDVAHGLEYLHTQTPPIVHADLKGNNVLITDDGTAALCDFGLSQVVEDLGHLAGLTMSNPSIGLLRWHAPELSCNDEPTKPTSASDVWSFGCTAFELLTSRIPYQGRTCDAQVMRDMQCLVKPSGPADEALGSFGQRVGALLDWCWSFDPSERPSMTQVCIELESICASRNVQC